MQQGDYSSVPYYHHHYGNISNPNPSPIPADHSPAPYASAPPFSTAGYSSGDYAVQPSSYPPTDLVPPPTAPSYASPPNQSPSLLPPSNFNPSPSQPGFEPQGAYQPPAQQPLQSDYSPPAPSYNQPPPAEHVPAGYSAPISTAHGLNSNLIPNPNPSSSNPPYSSVYSSSAPYNPPSYEPSYPNSSNYDHTSSYFDDYHGRSRSSLGSELYGKQSDASLYDSGRDNLYGDGVYAYQGGKVEPYGARGTAPKSSTWSGFDDYGRSISFPSSQESSSAGSPKIVRAVPKAETQQDVKSSVQKFRVKLLPESGSQSTMDVLCQVWHLPIMPSQ